MTAARRPRVRRGVLPAESEAAFMQSVEQLAKYNGWLIYHTHRSDRSPAGFPDLVLVRGVRLIFAEVKTDKRARRATVAEVAGRPEWLRMPDVTEHQARWLGKLRRVADAIDAWLPPTDLDADPDPLVPPLPGFEVCVWRPSDWPSIQRSLAIAANDHPGRSTNG